MHRLDLTCLFLDKLPCVLLPILCCSSTGVPSCVFCSVDNTHYPGIELQRVFGYSDINVPTLRHPHHLVRPWVFCLFFPSSAYTPDAMVLDTTSADDPYEARFQKIEGDAQGIRTDITSINTRMGTMTGDIISALRADRAAERPAEASSGPEPSTGTQLAFGTTTTPSASPSYMFMRRPKDTPFDMGPAPVDACVVVKEGDDGRQRRPSRS